MSKVLVSESNLTAIADAIREKNGSSDTYTPAEMAEAIEALSAASEIVDNPEYFYAEAVDTAQKINALRNAHTFTALFITDTHVYTSSDNLQYLDAQLASMNAIAKMIKPDLVIHGGDMTNGSEAKSITIGFTDHIVKCLREIGGDNTLILIGNHDGNTYGSDQTTIEAKRITEAEMLTMYRSWDDGFTYAGGNYQGGNFYGYRDYPSLNLRVIRLHSYREKLNDSSYNGGGGQNWGYYADEVTWFQNVALNTDNAILIFCHQTLSPVLQGYPESSEIPHNGMQIQQAIDNWLAADSTHRCVGVVHGHVHWDYAAKGKGTFQVFDHTTQTEITRTGTYGDFYEYGQCLANYLTSYGTTDTTPPTNGYRDFPIGAILRGRAWHTVTQGLWTAVIVDTDAESISFIRFGAGTDSTFGYGSTVYHSVSNTLTNATTSNAQTSIEDGASYTATITPTSGYTIDSAVVTMGGVDITSTAYSNGVITIASVTGDVSITVSASKPRVNLLPLAIENDGTSIYPSVTHPSLTTVGYAAGYRLGSGGTESAASGKYVTGFIPVKLGDTVTLENIHANTAAQDNNYIAFYDSSFTLLASCSRYVYAWHNQSGNAIKPDTVDGSGWLTSFTVTGTSTYNLANAAYFRLSANLIDSTSAVYVE